MRYAGEGLNLFANYAFFGILVACFATSARQADNKTFQLPQKMHASFEGRPLSTSATIGLSEVEISQILKAIIEGGLDDEDLRSPVALKKDLLVLRVDMGEGIGNGLAIQGAVETPFCGATGNCAIWFFRKSRGEWRPVPDDWGPLPEAEASRFAFVAPRHHGLYELITCTRWNAADMTIELWWFDGNKYLPHENYCSTFGKIRAGECR